MPQVSMRSVFEDCQGGMHGHGRLIKTLTKLYNASDADAFWADFEHHLKFSMVVFKREPAVERTIDFVCKFSASLATSDSNKNRNGENNEEEEEEEEEEMSPFLLKLFDFLLEHHDVKDKGVRFRCCQVVNKLLANLGDEAQIDDELYDRIYDCMLQRLKDKFAIVRQQAVLALSRLQDPTDRDCPVINAYIFLLGCDISPDVRRAVLGCIAASTKTLMPILERTRDEKDIVRRLAYQVIAEKIHIKALTIAQRVRILNEGLNDRTASVQDACSGRLLQAWLLHFSGNILELLSSLDVENSMDTCQKMLKVLFEKSPTHEVIANFDLVDDSLTIPLDRLNCESALYWQCLCEYLRGLGSEGEEFLEKILPSITDFCRYLQKVQKSMQNEESLEQRLQNDFILQQLLVMAKVLDLSDEVGRRNMKSLFRDFLLLDSVSESLVEPILDLYVQIVSDQDRRSTELVEVISDIKDPMTTVQTEITKEEQRKCDLKLAAIRVELNQLKEELDQCIRAQNFSRAAEIKNAVAELDTAKADLLDAAQPKSQEMRTERNDPTTLVKCLRIACELMKSLQAKSLCPCILTLVETLILPSVQSVDPAVRNGAVQALGLACLLSAEWARQHLLLFIQVAHMDLEAIQVTALKVILDLLLVFGLENFQVSANEEDVANQTADISMASREGSTPAKGVGEESRTPSSLLTILTSLLDSQSSEMRTVCAEGLAKLLLTRLLASPKLLSRLVLLWYNPLTEDDTRLRHCLGTFFPLYAFADRRNQEVVEEAFLPTLRTLWRAPSSSPLSEISDTNVANFFIQLTNKRLLQEAQKNSTMSHLANDTEESSCHDTLAVRLCNQILETPDAFSNRTMCRILTQLEISGNNPSSLKALAVLCQQMTEQVKDKQSLKYLEKFQGSIQELASKTNTVLDTPYSRLKEQSTVQAQPGRSQSEAVNTPSAEERTGVAAMVSDDSEEELSVFASPTPLRRGRNTSSAKTPSKVIAKKIRANLTQQLEEEMDSPAKSTRRSKRQAANRQPLCDKNEK